MLQMLQDMRVSWCSCCYCLAIAARFSFFKAGSWLRPPLGYRHEVEGSQELEAKKEAQIRGPPKRSPTLTDSENQAPEKTSVNLFLNRAESALDSGVVLASKSGSEMQSYKLQHKAKGEK